MLWVLAFVVPGIGANGAEAIVVGSAESRKLHGRLAVNQAIVLRQWLKKLGESFELLVAVPPCMISERRNRVEERRPRAKSCRFINSFWNVNCVETRNPIQLSCLLTTAAFSKEPTSQGKPSLFFLLTSSLGSCCGAGACGGGPPSSAVRLHKEGPTSSVADVMFL